MTQDNNYITTSSPNGSLLERQHFKAELTELANNAIYKLTGITAYLPESGEEMQMDQFCLDTYTVTPPYVITCNAFYVKRNA